MRVWIRRNRIALLALLTLVSFGVAIPLFAQAAAEPPTLEGVGSKAVVALGTVLIPVVTWVFRAKVWPNVPRILIPLAVLPALAAATATLESYVSGGHFSPVILALLTTSSLYLREVVSTAREHGLSP